MKKSALITGVTGQDGSYLAELLLEKDYEVYGIIRRNSTNNLGNSEHLKNEIKFIEADLGDYFSMLDAITLSKPHEMYNLAAQSHVGTSFKQPIYTLEATGLGPVNCIEAIRKSGFHTKFYQASTSEMFGGFPGTEPQNEKTSFAPRSPYGAAKLYAYEMMRIYRDSYRMFCTSGFLFNHESQRRGLNFVTRKITHAAARISLGLQDKLYLGNLDAKRDWGYAPDYVKGMWLMMQQPEPDDYVLATGETHTVRDFCKAAFERVNLNYEDYVEIDPRFYRPCEVHLLLGDSSKARETLGWKPETSFEGLVSKMVEYDLGLIQGQK